MNDETVSAQRTPVHAHAHRPLTVDWRAVLTGAVVALATHIVLVLLGTAIGLSILKPMSAGGSMHMVAAFTAVWALLSAVGSAIVGGLVAGLCTRGRSSTSGTVEGLGVWAVALLVTVAFVASSATAPLYSAPMAHAMPNLSQAMADVLRGVHPDGLASKVYRLPVIWTLVAAVVLSLLGSILGAVSAYTADVPWGFGARRHGIGDRPAEA